MVLPLRCFLAFLLCLPGVGWAHAPDAPLVLTLGGQPLALPTGLPHQVMQRDLLLQQKLAQGGITLSFRSFPDGKGLNHALAQGEIHGGVVGDMPAIQAVAKGQAVVLALAKMSYASVVSRDSQPLSSLKGRKVALVEGSSGHQTLLRAMKENGLAEDDLILTPMPLSDMARALDQDEVAAFVAWEPIPSQALREHPEFVIIYRGLTFSYFYLARALTEAHPQVAQEILAAYLRAIRWLMTPENLARACQWNNEAAAALFPESHAVTPEQCAAIAQRDLLEPAPSARIPGEILERQGLVAQQIAFLAAQGKLPGVGDPAAILAGFDPSWTHSLLQDPPLHALDTFSYSQTPLQPGK